MNVRKKIVLSVIIFFALAILVSLPLYRVYVAQADDTFTRNMFGSLPIAKVEGSSVPYRDYLMHLDAQKKFVKSPLADQANVHMTDQQMKQEAMTRALRIRLIETWAARDGVQVSQADIDKSYQGFVDRAGTSTDMGEVKQVMMDLFGWDENQFKQNMIRPALLEDTLSQKYVNVDSGKTADGFQKEIDDTLKGAKVYVKL